MVHMTFWQRVFVFSVGVALAFVVSVLAYWLLIDNVPPYRPVSVKIWHTDGSDSATFRPGEFIMVQRENCGRSEELLYFSRKLVRVDDGLTYVLASGSYLVEIGCRTTINTPQIPAYVLPGRYRYVVTAPYSNNPFQAGLIQLFPFEIDVIQ